MMVALTFSYKRGAWDMQYNHYYLYRRSINITFKVSIVLDMAAGVKLCTVQKWEKDLDPNKDWLLHTDENGMVVKICCGLCQKHEEKLKTEKFQPFLHSGDCENSVEEG